MKVILLKNDNLNLIDSALGLCWDKGCYTDKDKREKRIKNNALKLKHGSVLEFCNFVFEVKASAKVLLEMTRHRLASYACKSSRYTLNKGELVFEPTGDKDADLALNEFKKTYEVFIRGEYMKLISIDAGKAGWICEFTDGKLTKSYAMPVRKVIDKEAVTVYKHKDPKKLIKSGVNKGTRAKIIKTPQKSHLELDEVKLYEIISDCDFVVIEAQSGRKGNGASSSTTIDFNYGKMIAFLELAKFHSGIDFLEVQPNTWKKYFNLSISRKEKQEFIARYELLKDGKREFEKYKKQKSINKSIELGLANPKKHDEAEAYLIAKWYLEK